MITDEQAKATQLESLEYAFKVAQEQRYEALKNALLTVDAFAMVSCSPDQYTAFLDLRDYLLSMYSPIKKSIGYEHEMENVYDLGVSWPVR